MFDSKGYKAERGPQGLVGSERSGQLREAEDLESFEGVASGQGFPEGVMSVPQPKKVEIVAGVESGIRDNTPSGDLVEDSQHKEGILRKFIGEDSGDFHDIMKQIGQ